MHSKNRKQIELSQVPLFGGCRPDELRWIAKHGDVVEVKRLSVLAREGARSAEFVIVLDGVADCGDAETVYGPGSHLGAEGLLDGGREPRTVVALTDMRVVVFAQREFLGLVQRMPTVARKLLTAFAAASRDAQVSRSLRAVS
jgi:CRP-like cAMP-binding protein